MRSERADAGGLNQPRRSRNALRRLRGRVTTAVVTLFVVFGLALPALAYQENVYADCGSFGGFSSFGTVLNHQTHKKSGFSDQIYGPYSGTQTKSHSWGTGFTGWESATVASGNPIQDAWANCPS